VNRTRKLLATLLVLGAVGSVVASGTYSAFTATTSNTGNAFSAGTVAIVDDSGAATAMFAALTNQLPGAAVAKCIRVRYTGSLDSSVKLYVSAGITNGDKYTILVERAVGGTGLTDHANRNCTGFGAGGTTSTAFATADLNTFPTTYAAGVDGKASGAAWAQNDWVDYRFTITTKDDPTENAHTTTNPTGSFAFTWKAQNN
jgi:predicted ribosomally synthesized peptide with SipW-like signal peptide